MAVTCSDRIGSGIRKKKKLAAFNFLVRDEYVCMFLSGSSLFLIFFGVSAFFLRFLHCLYVIVGAFSKANDQSML